MAKTLLIGATSAVALLTAACGSNDGSAGNVTANDANAMIANAGNPFSQSEIQMNERTMAAVGTDIGDSWVRKVIERHQGAIDMSQIVLQLDPNADAAKMARMIEKQGKEIEDLRKLVKQGSPDPKSAEPYRVSVSQMHEAMMAAKGTDISITFLRKMLEHHKGGVMMSDVALQNGVSGAVRQHVQKTRDDQQKKLQMVEAMLRGESMSNATPQARVKSAHEAQAAPPPAARAKSAPEPTTKAAAPKTAPATEPKPTASAPAPTCAPEHRAAGHC